MKQDDLQLHAANVHRLWMDAKDEEAIEICCRPPAWIVPDGAFSPSEHHAAVIITTAYVARKLSEMDVDGFLEKVGQYLDGL